MNGLSHASFPSSVQKDTHVIRESFPELFATQHFTLHRYTVGVERFVSCTCGHVEEVFTDYWPRTCGLQAVVDSHSFISEAQFDRDLARTVESGARDSNRLNTLLYQGIERE